MKSLRIIGAILALLTLALIVFRCSPGEKVENGNSWHDTALAENSRQLDSLRKFSDSLKTAPPDTVRVKATRYVHQHDTLWTADTIHDTVARLTETVRWFMLSDSTCRQKLDSVTRTDSLHIMQRDGTGVELRSTRDSLRSEEDALHWKDVAMGGTGAIILLSLSSALIFFSP